MMFWDSGRLFLGVEAMATSQSHFCKISSTGDRCIIKNPEKAWVRRLRSA